MKISPHLLSLILFISNLSFSATLTSESYLDGLISIYIGDFGNGFQLDRESIFPGLNKDYKQNTFLFGYQLDGTDVSVPYLNHYKDYQISTSNDLCLGLNKVIRNSSLGLAVKDINLLNKKLYESSGFETKLMSSYSFNLTAWGVLPKGLFRGIAFNLKLYNYKDNEYSDFRFYEENKDYNDSLVLSVPFNLRENRNTEEASGNSVQLNLLFNETKNGGFLFAGGGLKTSKSQNEFVRNIGLEWEKTYLIENVSDSGDTAVELKDVIYVLAIPREVYKEVILQQGEVHLGYIFPQINNFYFAVNGGFRYTQKKALSQHFYALWDGSDNSGFKITGDFYNSDVKKYSDSISLFLESYFNKRFELNSFNIDLGLNGIIKIEAFDTGKNNVGEYFDKPLYYYENKSIKEISLAAPVYLSYVNKKIFVYIGWCPRYISVSKVGLLDGYEKTLNRNLEFSSLELGLLYKVNDKISFHLTPGFLGEIKFLRSRLEVKW